MQMLRFTRPRYVVRHHSMSWILIHLRCGMERTSAMLPLPLLVSLSSSGIRLTMRVLLPLPYTTSWCLIYLVFTVLLSATVVAIGPSPNALSSSVHGGFRQRLIDLQRYSPLTSSISSTSSRTRTNAIHTISTMRLFSARMPPGWTRKLYIFVYCVCSSPANRPFQHRYNEMTLVLRLWAHLQLLKRGGAVHRTSTSHLSSDGSIALHCPACPHPGKNTIDLPNSELYD